MATIKVKNSVTSGSNPTGLTFGELAVNISDKKIYIGNAVGSTITLHDQNNVVTSVNGATGSVSNIAVTNAAQTFSGLQSFSTGISAATILAQTVGGDEGGQVDFGNPITNTSLTGGVAIDIYQNRMRFFEKGGSARGYYIDLSAGGAGVGTNLVSSGSASGVSTYNGRTGDVQGVSAAVAGIGISVSGATGNVTITNAGVVSLNGSTGSLIGFVKNDGTTPFLTQAQPFNAGLSATSGCSFNNATVYITNSSAVDPLHVAHTSANALKVSTTGQARTGSIRLGNAATATQNTFISQTDGTMTFYNGLSTTGGNMISFSSSAITVPTTISGATFATNIVRFFTGISASGGTFSSVVDFNTGLSANGATFNGAVRFNSGISAGGATFASIVGFNSGISANGATFSGLFRSTSGISANGAITGGSYLFAESGFRVGSSAINSQTGTSYTLLAADNGEIIVWSTASAGTLTIPSGLPVGFNATLIQTGTASIGITGSGTTLNSFEGKLRTAGQHAAVSIISYSSNVFNIAGGLTG